MAFSQPPLILPHPAPQEMVMDELYLPVLLSQQMVVNRNTAHHHFKCNTRLAPVYLSQHLNILRSSLKGWHPFMDGFNWYQWKTSPCAFSRDQKRMDVSLYLSRLAIGIIAWKYLEQLRLYHTLKTIIETEHHQQNFLWRHKYYIPFTKGKYCCNLKKKRKRGRKGGICVPFSLSIGHSFFLLLNFHPSTLPIISSTVLIRSTRILELLSSHDLSRPALLQKSSGPISALLSLLGQWDFDVNIDLCCPHSRVSPLGPGIRPYVALRPCMFNTGRD